VEVRQSQSSRAGAVAGASTPLAHDDRADLPNQASETPAALELRGGWKTFGHVVALRDVDFSTGRGEITAIVGDNGAGKSTLVKVLSGVYRLDRGTLTVEGRELSRGNAKAFSKLGISTVFQDLALVETLDVATNMFIDQPITRGRVFARRAAMYRRAARTLQELKVNVPSVRVPIGELSGGQRQSVAIARAVLHEDPIIIMDEPTAALGVRETMRVGDILEELKAQRRAVVLVSHDLEFVFRHADVIQVMRLGSVSGRVRVAETDRQTVIGLITGLRPQDAGAVGAANGH
jgi:ABC-type sugar transport system ATPase subunit